MIQLDSLDKKWDTTDIVVSMDDNCWRRKHGGPPGTCMKIPQGVHRMESNIIHKKKGYPSQDFVGIYQFTTMKFSSEPNEIRKSFTN